MPGMLEGKAALITGGARGIGRAAAELFAAEGARVLVADMNLDGAAETVARINEAGGQAVSCACDVTDSAQVDAMVAAAVAAFGRLDCAFNNAGVAPYQVGAAGKLTADWPESGVDQMIDINLKGVWRCMRAELMQMATQPEGGAIVNTASIAGLAGLPTSSLYVAAKHGVVGLTKTAAIEYAKQSIRVNSVCPGYIETDMTRDTMARRGDTILTRVPAGRMGQPGDIAEMTCWLMSDRAGFVTGANYNVDGGFIAS